METDFWKKFFKKALIIELIRLGFFIEAQKKIEVYYRGEVIGEYYSDIVVDDKIIIELKCVDKFVDFHKAQLLNYLKATKIELGILINFPNSRKGFDIERVPNFMTKIKKYE